MEATTFDALLRRAAQHTTRRRALGAIIAAALISADAPGGATKKARRRKKKKNASIRIRPIGLWIDNTAGTNAVTLQNGDTGSGACCGVLPPTTVAPGERKWIGFRRNTNTETSAAYIAITSLMPNNPKYWISFFNGLGLPTVSAATYGQTAGNAALAWCCYETGDPILSPKGLNVNEQVNITIQGNIFNVRRNKDTNYKVFTITLPPGL